MSVNSLVPESKDDLGAVEALRSHILQHGYDSDVISAIPQLLSWVVDLHWPVASAVADVLRDGGALLVEPIREILESEDAAAKFAILTAVVRNLDAEVIRVLVPTLSLVVSKGDEEGAAEAAAEIIEFSW
jgi:hypothetical protein